MFVRAAWLYTRASESIRIEVREEPTQFMLVVHGPGPECHYAACADYLAVTQAQLEYEARVIAQGFILEGLEQWEPQRRSPRAGSSARRSARAATTGGAVSFDQSGQR